MKMVQHIQGFFWLGKTIGFQYVKKSGPLFFQKFYVKPKEKEINVK